MTTRTVKVSNVSLSAAEKDIQDFFSFSGVIEYVEMKRDDERSQIVFVTFKDVQGAETAVLLSRTHCSEFIHPDIMQGATIVDQTVTIALEPNYTLPAGADTASYSASENNNAGGGDVSAAEDVVSGMLAKGYILGKDALNRAKSFDERHQLSSTASARVASLDRKMGLSQKFTVGATMVNDKVKEVDQKFQVSEKTKTAFTAAEQTVSNAGSAIMKNRYVLTGATWVTGAFSRVQKAAGDVGQRTMEKVAVEEQGRNAADGYTQLTTAESPRAGSGDKKPDSPKSPKGLVL